MLKTYCWKCGKRISINDVLGIGRFDKNTGKYGGRTFLAFKCPGCKKVRYQISDRGLTSLKKQLQSGANKLNFKPFNITNNIINYNQVINFYKELKTIDTVNDFLIRCRKNSFNQKPEITKPIIQPLDVYNIFKKLNKEKCKRLLVLTLDTENYPLAWEMFGEGTKRDISFEPRIVFHIPFLVEEKTGVIIADNLNNKSNQPSRKKILLTKKLVKAAKLLNIDFLDHIIIEEKGYHSFDQLNLL